ncbi:MAG TPA: hypothetical protein PK322_00335 [Opitutaceae bacterium]|nr:hypothetical protein [Opitutaceae bacterium]
MTTLCRIYLAVLSGYHVLTGIVSFAFPQFAFRFYAALYACNPAERRQLVLVMKPWGALALCAGVAGLFAAADPVRYWGVVAALWLLLVLRIVFRLVWRAELAEVGRIPAHRNLLSTGIIAAGAVILGAWLVRHLSLSLV